jgi:hypothetical protein
VFILDERIERPVCGNPIVQIRSIEVTDAALVSSWVPAAKSLGSGHADWHQQARDRRCLARFGGNDRDERLQVDESRALLAARG